MRLGKAWELDTEQRLESHRTHFQYDRNLGNAPLDAWESKADKRRVWTDKPQ